MPSKMRMLWLEGQRNEGDYRGGIYGWILHWDGSAGMVATRMNRRSFLSLFAGAAASIVVPKTSYFFAPKNGWLPRLPNVVPIQVPLFTELGGNVGAYNPDGGSYFQGQGSYATVKNVLVHLGPEPGIDRAVDLATYEHEVSRFLAACPKEMSADMVERAIETYHKRWGDHERMLARMQLSSVPQWPVGMHYCNG